MLAQFGDITAKLAQGQQDHEERIGKAEHNLSAAAAAMNTVITNVDEVKVELGKIKAPPPGVGGSTDVGHAIASGGVGRDPWAEALGGSAFGPTAKPPKPQQAPGLGGLKEKDFPCIDKLDGTVVRHAD